MLELWFDFSCPYAYLASRKAPAIARAAGVELDWRPMLLGGVFRGIGAGDGPMATLGAAKAAHNLHDMHRWAELFGVPFQLPATHPMRTVRALRVLLALPHSRWPAAIDALYAAYWQRAEDITRDEVIAAALRGAGTTEADITTALQRADDADIKDELRRRTDEAIGLGIFGAPAWVLRRDSIASAGSGHLLIWGQDRIAWVEAALAGWDPDAGPSPGPNSSGRADHPLAGGARPLGTDVQGFHSPRTLDVYFDVSSPFAYFALTQLPALARVSGVVPTLHPILLGGLFRDIHQNDVPLFSMPPPKLAYMLGEMERWPRWWGIDYDKPDKFPQRTTSAQRLVLLARDHGATAGFDVAVALATALGRAMWAEQRDIGDADTLRGILGDVGLPPEWVERTQEPAVKQALVDETTAAAKAGVFGVPTFVIGSAAGGSATGDRKYLVWGQDRLELVLRMLGGWDPRW